MAPLPTRPNRERREGGTIDDAATQASWRAARRASEILARVDDKFSIYLTKLNIYDVMLT